jgi:alpha-L-rhamnosidase
MNSFNHYSYGAIGDWMYKTMAGLNPDPAAPGYKKIIIAPKPGGGITSAAAELETQYGKVRSAWKIEGGKMMLDVIVPPNTTAKIILPTASATITESNTDLNKVAYLKDISKKDNTTEMSAGSGSYHFEYANN